jgi:hypothetical protein
MNVPFGEKNGDSAFARLAEARRIAGLDRRRWMSLAASILAGVLVGTLLWVVGLRNSLPADLLEHLDQEPGVMVATTRPEDVAVVARVLRDSGIRLRAEAGLLSHANSCRIRGRAVPHFVVQAEGGPVTVLVLRGQQPAAPVSFAGRGFSGRIVPAGPGSIAVIAAADADLAQVAARMLAAVEWL